MSDPKDPQDPQNMPDTEGAPETPAEDAAAADSTGDTPWAEGGEPTSKEALEAAADALLTPEAQIAELESQVNDLRDRLLRAVADAENTRKRAERDKQDASKYAMTSFARDILSVGDNMRRAIDTLSEEDRQGVPEPVRNLIEGVEMTEREFLSVMERHGVKAINPHGEKFDPNLHQAMFEAPDPTRPAGTVMEVVATGYVIGDRLLRPAMVGISKGGPAVAPQPAAEAAPETPADPAPEAADPDKPTPGSKIDTKA
ncbi:Heat shock protein GrpE [Candidatus Phaeomarinobacter ectocarpi]|uniref:Protein GrpE n=1 Tax=Candidatus Phaeomarinibacter ectocarpi TaxID=1458461 RepID=X5M8V9_9HYPH|nr:nucleotide exchange factor GrpE [Candidatus Phaeomarinobacter ectocarpi]CDO59813.1 Heat shock protein GrpE [Candidatus Phaeomarinobacter ectocarpi]